ncbi:lactonase family protein [Bacillus cereus group sp. Bc222]|uniref:lactonase family protein n=1 Tax=Bacillus cereus group sp. Bc222 TaxID=3018111 RepID=UPI0022E15100|nr:lactonase family protein [Bacillus cereus group sp. Bc222]MDA2241165.1 lactonase family protein [Bacillus cereus group sp. Bc222]
MNNNECYGYIGTYTNGNSKGIYRFVLDVAKAIIKDIQVVAHLDNPTYLAINKDNQHLYSVVKKGEFGGVAAFSIHSQMKTLDLLNTQVLEGKPPCYVGIDNTNQTLVTANYHKGTIESYLINKDGMLTPAISIMEHKASGTNAKRQKQSHIHFAGFTPDNKYVLAVDLGIDQLITYKEKKGVLTKVNYLSLRSGSGPRHLVFHPNGKYVYVMTELSSEIIVLAYREKDGSFSEVQYISTLPKRFLKNNQGSAIQISSYGEFVYAANRGHNSIVVFRVNQDSGRLIFVDSIDTEGNWPRDFVLDPTEKFLLVSNEKSSNLVLFSRDKHTGKLTLLQSDIIVPNPVCLKFLNY